MAPSPLDGPPSSSPTPSPTSITSPGSSDGDISSHPDPGEGDPSGGDLPHIRLRPARIGDAEAIRAIYNHEVLSTTATFDLVPRSLEDQQQWLAARSGAFAAIVAEDLESSEVVGFAALSPYRERAAYRTSVEDSIYVRRDRAGAGIGRLLLERLLDTAESSGFHSVFARIEAGSEASRALHGRCGFRLVGVEYETGRKFNRWLDVALMQCLLHQRRSPPAR